MNLLEMCAQISMKIINIATESTTRSMIGKSITIVGAGEEVGMVETKGLDSYDRAPPVPTHNRFDYLSGNLRQGRAKY